MASPSTARSSARNPAAFILGQVMFATRIILLLVHLIGCLILHVLWRLFRQNSPWPRLFLGGLAWISGIAPKPLGRRLKNNVFYASNHVSWVDIPTLAGVSGCTFIAKSTLDETPLIGWLCRLNNTIFVAREDKLGVGRQIEKIREALDGQQPVTIFPEGTTHDAQSLLPFKPSLFEVLSPPPRTMMVQPVYLTYGSQTPHMAWLGDESAVRNFWRLLSRIRPLEARLHFLEPFDPEQLGHRKAISAEVRRRIGLSLESGGQHGLHL